MVIVVDLTDISARVPAALYLAATIEISDENSRALLIAPVDPGI